MSDFCSTFAPNLNTIMEKRTYIQPEMAVELLRMEAMMLPGSPTDGGSDPHTAPARDAAGPKDVMF